MGSTKEEGHEGARFWYKAGRFSGWIKVTVWPILAAIAVTLGKITLAIGAFIWTLLVALADWMENASQPDGDEEEPATGTKAKAKTKQRQAAKVSTNGAKAVPGEPCPTCGHLTPTDKEPEPSKEKKEKRGLAEFFGVRGDLFHPDR